MAGSTARVAAAAALTVVTLAHYNLKDPMPYNPIDCNVPDCFGPCPPIWRSGGAAARNGPSNPSRVWRRGEKVAVEWHRNNHEGGFYRRSLVPVRHMNDHGWHRRAAFEWGCFTQNRYTCGRNPSCGTDKEHYAYRNHMTVPQVLPDGDYVFAMVWFGGLHWRRKRGYFSDYWTCAFVKIQGGPVSHQHTPTFNAGRNYRSSVTRGKCAATSNWVGQCGGYPCQSNPVWMSIPGIFQKPYKPPKVFLTDIQIGMGIKPTYHRTMWNRSLQRRSGPKLPRTKPSRKSIRRRTIKKRRRQKHPYSKSKNSKKSTRKSRFGNTATRKRSVRRNPRKRVPNRIRHAQSSGKKRIKGRSPQRRAEKKSKQTRARSPRKRIIHNRTNVKSKQRKHKSRRSQRKGRKLGRFKRRTNRSAKNQRTSRRNTRNAQKNVQRPTPKHSLTSWRQRQSRREKDRKRAYIRYWTEVLRRRGRQRAENARRNRDRPTPPPPKPPKPTGTWGPRGSVLWWNQRNAYWKWKNYCTKYPWTC